MQQADVVIYDRLVSAPILELCRRDATKIYVGKARSNHSVPKMASMLYWLSMLKRKACLSFKGW